MKKRMVYALLFAAVMGIEIWIATEVKGGFVRLYLGDVLAVIAVYLFVRVIVPDKLRWLPLYVFIFAVGIELAQLFQVLKLLGLSSNRFLRVWMGTGFDWIDLVCYAAGCLLAAAAEYGRKRYCRKKGMNRYDI